jgi:hypothetical protein
VSEETFHDCEFVPLLIRLPDGREGWERQLTTDPRYPWQCRFCDEVVYKPFSAMVSEQWVRLVT